MRRAPSIAAMAVALALAGPSRAAAQFAVRCSSGSEDELRHDMREHVLNTAMLDDKFRHVNYGAGHGADAAASVSLEVVRQHLASLAPRRAALLFQARESGGPLCTWLVTAKGITSDVARVDGNALASLRPRLLRALGLDEKLRGCAPVRRGFKVPFLASADPAESADEILRQASRLLLPDAIARELAGQQIDTLVLVPSADVGTFPVAALPVGGRPLVELASIVIAPGFDVFSRPSPPTPRPLQRAVIVGNPSYPRDRDYELPNLPGAQAEAQEVARLVSADALLGKGATIGRVRALLSSPGPAPNPVYLATHGLADAENPLDGSTLWLSDRRWSARQVSRLPLERGHPLVVLSACQTGLGKTFEVGTIGMSRAWVKAGAASVVMSLWRVDDLATKVLMTRFLALAASMPVDRALQRAMLETRCEFPDVARWASFAVMGLPEREP